jgi:hypothetical protein
MCRRVGVKSPSVGRAELQFSLVRVADPRGRARARAYRRWTYDAFSPEQAITPKRRCADTSLGHFVALFSVSCVRVDARSLSLDADDVVS